jgi:ribonuclease HII
MARLPVIDRFLHERSLLASGVGVLAGVDEAGRGPLAGPVVAAAVVLPRSWVLEGIPDQWAGLNDSKQLSEARRERFFEAPVDAGVIDAINILQATHRAMNEALAGLGQDVEHALVDGRPVRSLRCRQTALVKGDGLSYSIAAASVLAKVTRDRMMLEADSKWPGYGFAVHKGYPTAQHLVALARLGPCPIHRLSFGPLRNTGAGLFPA